MIQSFNNWIEEINSTPISSCYDLLNDYKSLFTVPSKPINKNYWEKINIDDYYWEIMYGRKQIHGLKKLFKIDGTYYYEGLVFEKFPKYSKPKLYSSYFEVYLDDDNENRVIIKTDIDFKDRKNLVV